MTTRGELHSSLNSTPDGGERSVKPQQLYPQGKNPGNTETDGVWALELVCTLWRKVSYSAEK